MLREAHSLATCYPCFSLPLSISLYGSISSCLVCSCSLLSCVSPFLHSPPRPAVLILHHAQRVDRAVLLELLLELLLGGVVANLADEQGLVRVTFGLLVLLWVPLSNPLLQAFFANLQVLCTA